MALARMPLSSRYDRIGFRYAEHRSEDPSIKAAIAAALGEAQTVLNVGAGTGSYEPADRHVIAAEPSAVMAAQRPAGRPAIRAFAQNLPFHDNSMDAAMTVLSLHHWHPDQEAGIREMCRVAKKTVLVVTVDPIVSGKMWLMADYLPEVQTLDQQIFPAPETLQYWMDRPSMVHTLPIARDSPDHSLISYWAHPERVLDANARQATSGFARQTEAVIERVVSAVEADLANGAWDHRHGHLRALDAYDAGLRMIVAQRD